MGYANIHVRTDGHYLKLIKHKGPADSSCLHDYVGQTFRLVGQLYDNPHRPTNIIVGEDGVMHVAAATCFEEIG